MRTRNKPLIGIVMMLLLCSVAIAIDFNPMGDVNLKGRYAVKNGTWASFTNLTVSNLFTTIFFSNLSGAPTHLSNFTNDLITSGTWNASSISTTRGTPSGNLSMIQLYDDITYNISEASGANPLNTYVNFTGITSNLSAIILREQYRGGSGHAVDVYLWDYNTSSWESYQSITDQNVQNIITIGIYDSSKHISGGLTQLMFNHTSSGISSHRLYIDYLVLQWGTSGITTNQHDSLSGRDSSSNHPWAMPKATYTSLSNFSDNLNYSTKNVNSSEYWDALNSPVDITSLGALNSLDVNGAADFDSSVTIHNNLNMNGTNITNTNRVTASYFVGDGSLLTGLTNISSANVNHSNSTEYWDNLNSPADITSLGALSHTGNVNMTGKNITDVDWLYVHNISGYSPITIQSNIEMGANNITTSGKFVGDGSLLTALSIAWASVLGKATHLSNFTDDLGNRGYSDLANFSNSPGYTTNSAIQSVVNYSVPIGTVLPWMKNFGNLINSNSKAVTNSTTFYDNGVNFTSANVQAGNTLNFFEMNSSVSQWGGCSNTLWSWDIDLSTNSSYGYKISSIKVYSGSDDGLGNWCNGNNLGSVLAELWKTDGTRQNSSGSAGTYALAYRTLTPPNTTADVYRVRLWSSCTGTTCSSHLQKPTVILNKNVKVQSKINDTALQLNTSVWAMNSSYYKIYASPTLEANWAECDGSTVTDTASPYYNQALPNLNSNILIGGTSSGTSSTIASGSGVNTYSAVYIIRIK